MSFDPTNVPAVRLNDGSDVPQFGFGVFQIPTEQTVTAVRTALDAGYRHIDTAQMYGNEAEVGRAIAESGVAREEIFVTTKLNNGCHGYDAALGALDESLRKLGFDYVDLFLIHWPRPQEGRYVETWTALEKLKADGKARSIGVSNFTVEHLERLAERTGTVPAVNQIELHPQFPQAALRAYHAEHGIATEAWSPIGQGGDLLEDERLRALADAARPVARAGRAALAHPARQHRVPEVGDPGADPGEHRRVRLRAVGRRHGRRRRPRHRHPQGPRPRPVRLRISRRASGRPRRCPSARSTR